MAANLQDQAKREVSKVTMKSHQIAQDKLVRDIERILDYVDFDGTGFFSIRQVRSCRGAGFPAVHGAPRDLPSAASACADCARGGESLACMRNEPNALTSNVLVQSVCYASAFRQFLKHQFLTKYRQSSLKDNRNRFFQNIKLSHHYDKHVTQS